MKAIFLLGIGVIAMFNKTFAQCPEAGLNIEMPGCEEPANLTVSNVSCSSVTVNWLGDRSLSYLVKASYTKPASELISETETTDIVCDGTGYCRATITAAERAAISWSVQAICPVKGVTIYSARVNGPGASLASCEKVAVITKASTLQLYPNPAVNYLNVQLDGGIAGSVEFRIFDIAGKQVYYKAAGAVTKKLRTAYRLDPLNLVAGTYLLEVHHDNETKQAKFVVLKKK